jgi:hypothetical protein
MVAGVHPITFEQGATFELYVECVDSNDEPLDLTDCTAKLTVRKSYSATEDILVLETDDGIIIDEEAGTLYHLYSADDTAALEIPHGSVYQLDLSFPTGKVVRLLRGEASLSKGLLDV